MVAITLSSPKPTKKKLSVVFKIEDWERLKPKYEELHQREIRSKNELEQWILDRNELAAKVGEDFAWRYIKLTTNTTSKTAAKRYEYYIQHLSPNISKYDFLLNQKLVACPFTSQLDPHYHIYIRSIRNEHQLFKEENIARNTEERLIAKKYGVLLADVSVAIDGKKYTIQQTNPLLEQHDRTKREQVYRKTSAALRAKKEGFEQIFNELVKKRHEIALEAGFEDFRAYKFKQLGRFDYSIEDCVAFQASIKQEIVPLLTEVYERKKKRLKLETLKPWDLAAYGEDHVPLRPFKNEAELVEKATQCLRAVDPYFGDCITKMRDKKHLDLEARAGKRPGGYNMPLLVTGVPFIFMNAARSVLDMRTFMHESGHAVHAFLTNDLALVTAKQPPSEIAEFAAMSMELLTMDKWHYFFDCADDLKRAQIWLLENILQLLPWIATIDAFQHWIYTHPAHTPEDRRLKWLALLEEFGSPAMDRSDLEEQMSYLWHRQLHLFEVPFYYIEYGMAQLGAIALWKNYKENGQATVEAYTRALKLGYSKSITEVYAEAGIKFDFSPSYVKELAQFLKEEIRQLLES
ncbi:MAG: M3 family oligoendopeptidase [Bacteroidota bacterium]